METIKLTDASLMPWGKKFKGKKMIDVPALYLLYCFENGYIPSTELSLIAYIKDNWESLKLEASRAKH